MFSTITGILSTTVGLLWNKARDKTAEKLKGGDVTAAKVQEIVVRELNDIKTNLDSLSRAHLLSRYCFFSERVELLSSVSINRRKKTAVNHQQYHRAMLHQQHY